MGETVTVEEKIYISCARCGTGLPDAHACNLCFPGLASVEAERDTLRARVTELEAFLQKEYVENCANCGGTGENKPSRYCDPKCKFFRSDDMFCEWTDGKGNNKCLQIRPCSNCAPASTILAKGKVRL